MMCDWRTALGITSPALLVVTAGLGCTRKSQMISRRAQASLKGRVSFSHPRIDRWYGDIQCTLCRPAPRRAAGRPSIIDHAVVDGVEVEAKRRGGGRKRPCASVKHSNALARSAEAIRKIHSPKLPCQLPSHMKFALCRTQAVQSSPFKIFHITRTAKVG
jgi:hypothetical protein